MTTQELKLPDKELEIKVHIIDTDIFLSVSEYVVADNTLYLRCNKEPIK